MKINNTEEENLISWTTWGISMKFSRTIWLRVILKVTKKQGFTLSLEDTFLEKPQGGDQIEPPPSHLSVNTSQQTSSQRQQKKALKVLS